MENTTEKATGYALAFLDGALSAPRMDERLDAVAQLGAQREQEREVRS